MGRRLPWNLSQILRLLLINSATIDHHYFNRRIRSSWTNLGHFDTDGVKGNCCAAKKSISSLTICRGGLSFSSTRTHRYQEPSLLFSQVKNTRFNLHLKLIVPILLGGWGLLWCLTHECSSYPSRTPYVDGALWPWCDGRENTYVFKYKGKNIILTPAKPSGKHKRSKQKYFSMWGPNKKCSHFEPIDPCCIHCLPSPKGA